MDKTVIAAGVGCILALTLWKGSREQWFPSLLGLCVVGYAIKLADGMSFPLDLLIFGGGIAVLGLGKWLWIDKGWRKLADFCTVSG